MGKVKVPILGTVGKSVNIEADAPSRTEMDAAIARAIAAALSVAAAPGGNTGGVARTLWRLIGEIPANIRNFALLSGTGLVARLTGGNFIVRTLLAGDGIHVDNGNGNAGNPTVVLDAVLDDLNDVDVPAPDEGDVLTYDGTSGLWIAEPPSGGGFPDATYITETDERADLPNSLRLLAGTNVTFDTTTDGELEISSSGSGGGFLPWITTYDTLPVSPNAMDDEFDGPSFDTAKWTWGNQGSATIQQDTASVEHAIMHTAGGSGDNYRLLYQTVPGGNWRFRAKMFASIADSNFAQAGLFLRNSANGKLYAFGPLFAGSQGMYIQAMTSVTSYNSTPYSINSSFLRYVYLDIEYDGTNLIFRWAAVTAPWNPFPVSPPFITALTVTPASFLGAVPDQVGFCGDSNNGQPVDTFMKWFRRTA